MRTLREDQLPAFIEAVVGVGNPLIASAVRLQRLTAVRPGEVLEAVWLEVDLEAVLWTIPTARMKCRRPHVVPLSTQAVALLRALRLLTGQRTWLFRIGCTRRPKP